MTIVWPPCHHTRGQSHLFYGPNGAPEQRGQRLRRQQAALAICARCPFIEACDKHARRFPWPDGFVIAGRIIIHNNMEARNMAKPANIDWTPHAEEPPARQFRVAAVNEIPVTTLQTIYNNPGVWVRVLTAETITPATTRSKHLRSGIYGCRFITVVRKVEEGPDTGKYGVWAMREVPTDEPAPLRPASELEAEAS